jgi:hypothetical protein
MTARKFLLRLVAVYTIALVLVYLFPQPIHHRRAFDKAFMTWLHDRTHQNEEALRAEQRKNEMLKLADSAVIALALIVLGTGIYLSILFVGRRLDRRRTRHNSEIPDVR